MPSVVHIPKNKTKKPITIILSGSNQKLSQECKQQRRPWLQQLVSSAHVFIFSPCLPTEKTSGRGPCLWRTEEGNVHSNILSRAYTFSVSLTSISGSGWIWCGEDAAALISDVPLVLSLFLHSTWQGHASNYWGKETHLRQKIIHRGCNAC